MSRMEQYFMPKKLDSKNIRLCLDNYKAENLYIRLKGSCGGTVKVDESLEGRTLDFKKDESGLYFLVDENEVFHFPLKRYDKGFFIEYKRRIKPTDDRERRAAILYARENPYDPNLPEPEESILRNVLDYHLIEISFKGRVHLKFHSWWIEPHWKYWTVTDKPPQK